jgi:hypothetical protein
MKLQVDIFNSNYNQMTDQSVFFLLITIWTLLVHQINYPELQTPTWGILLRQGNI